MNNMSTSNATGKCGDQYKATMMSSAAVISTKGEIYRSVESVVYPVSTTTNSVVVRVNCPELERSQAMRSSPDSQWASSTDGMPLGVPTLR